MKSVRLALGAHSWKNFANMVYRVPTSSKGEPEAEDGQLSGRQVDV